VRDDFVNRGPGLGTIVSLSFLISVIVSGGMYLTLREVIPPKPSATVALDDAVDVPSVTGVDVTQARGLLDPKGLLLMLDGDRDDAAPVGSICVQTPLAGSRLPRGSTVHATVSKGQTKVHVPDVAGQLADKATSALGTAGLAVGGTDSESNANVPSGTVIGTTPSAGSEVAKGSAVKLRVSSGPGMVDVPKVTGLVINKARELLAPDKFVIKTKTGYDSEHGDWVVLTQDPAAGAKALPGSTINLLVNDGQ
jgi:serine/threonine-protein kinase